MITRGRRLREDYWACYHDYDVEMAEIAAQKAHERGECEGAPWCAYCIEERERREESRGDE